MWTVQDEYGTCWTFETKQEALDFYWDRGNEDYHLEIFKPDGKPY